MAAEASFPVLQTLSPVLAGAGILGADELVKILIPEKGLNGTSNCQIYNTICGCDSRIPSVTTCNVNGRTDYTCSHTLLLTDRQITPNTIIDFLLLPILNSGSSEHIITMNRVFCLLNALGSVLLRLQSFLLN